MSGAVQGAGRGARCCHRRGAACTTACTTALGLNTNGALLPARRAWPCARPANYPDDLSQCLAGAQLPNRVLYCVMCNRQISKLPRAQRQTAACVAGSLPGDSVNQLLTYCWSVCVGCAYVQLRPKQRRVELLCNRVNNKNYSIVGLSPSLFAHSCELTSSRAASLYCLWTFAERIIKERPL